MGDRKGGEIGRIEVRCFFVGILVKVFIEKFFASFIVVRERWGFLYVNGVEDFVYWEGGKRGIRI